MCKDPFLYSVSTTPGDISKQMNITYLRTTLYSGGYSPMLEMRGLGLREVRWLI